jgi:hypothetical protein
VRPGTIYFVNINAAKDPGSGTFNDPWKSPKTFYQTMKPGDICYFRAGVYASKYGEQNTRYNISIGEGAPSGKPDNEIAWVAYPGESVTFMADSEGISGNIEFREPKNSYVFAGFKMYASGVCVELNGNNNRIVNNSCEGLKNHAYANIHTSGGRECKVYGNELFGARSANKLDHLLYVALGTSFFDFGWNYIHDNDVAVGPAISINTDGSLQSNTVFENIRIHDNTIDCRNSSEPLRAVGIVETGRGSTVYLYNNVIIGGGSDVRYYAGIYQYSGSAYIYNNTIYQVKGPSVMMITNSGDYHPETVDIRNNIIYPQGGSGYITVDGEDQMGKVIFDRNCYYNNGNSPSRDAHAVNADPLFVDPDNGDFHLKARSPCIDAGSNTTAAVKTDKSGMSRPQSTAVSIGAYEYVDRTASAKKEPSRSPEMIALAAGKIKVIGSANGQGTVNPSKGETVRIYFKGEETGQYECRIFSRTGEQVYENTRLNAREGYFEWNPKNAVRGLYVVTVLGPGLHSTTKISVLE